MQKNNWENIPCQENNITFLFGTGTAPFNYYYFIICIVWFKLHQNGVKNTWNH